MVAVISALSEWAIPALIFFIPVYAFLRRVGVYESFVTGAQEGFATAVKIIPFMVGMLVAIGVFRASGAMDIFAAWLNPLVQPLGLPAELLPLAIMRPLSGGGALGITAELINTHGPDSLVGRLASVMQGSTDTTFYVLTVYFGSVGIRKYRYALVLGLTADIVGLFASVLFSNWYFGR